MSGLLSSQDCPLRHCYPLRRAHRHRHFHQHYLDQHKAAIPHRHHHRRVLRLQPYQPDPQGNYRQRRHPAFHRHHHWRRAIHHL
jgi:hypothetical protein